MLVLIDFEIMKYVSMIEKVWFENISDKKVLSDWFDSIPYIFERLKIYCIWNYMFWIGLGGSY